MWEGGCILDNILVDISLRVLGHDSEIGWIRYTITVSPPRGLGRRKGMGLFGGVGIWRARLEEMEPEGRRRESERETGK